jgi:hypothetical protein
VNKGLTPKERLMRTIKRQDIDCLPTQIDFSGACLDKMLKYWDLANELDAVAFLGNHVVYAYLNDAVGNIKARQLAGDEISFDSWGSATTVTKKALYQSYIPWQIWTNGLSINFQTRMRMDYWIGRKRS